MYYFFSVQNTHALQYRISKSSNQIYTKSLIIVFLNQFIKIYSEMWIIKITSTSFLLYVEVITLIFQRLYIDDFENKNIPSCVQHLYYYHDLNF